MRFESPWALLILLAIPAVIYLHRRRHVRGSLRFSSTDHAKRSGQSARQRLLGTPLWLRVAALVFLSVGLARPQVGKERVRDISKGIAIEMVVDRSGSMGTEMEEDGKAVMRLDVVKKVFEEFVKGNSRDLPGRPSDLIGMIAFARYPDTICPMTLAHGALSTFLENVKLVQRRNEDGTAIGDALALAAARLKTAEETVARQRKGLAKDYEIKSKIIILLTDGQNNYGKRSPLEAAELARKWGIKIYTIGIGGQAGPRTIQTPLGSMQLAMAPGVDEATLKALAQKTGGIYRAADDAESLRAVYEEIDQLERSEIESVRFLDYRERFLPFALIALGMLALETAMGCTIMRRIP